jgi:hypothetical protein
VASRWRAVRGGCGHHVAAFWRRSLLELRLDEFKQRADQFGIAVVLRQTDATGVGAHSLDTVIEIREDAIYIVICHGSS